MDATYRSDLRELNELNFARFDSKLEATLELRIGELRSELESRISQLDLRVTGLRADLVKWMFVFWIGTLAPLAGLIVVLTR